MLRFQEELTQLQDHLLEMAGLVKAAIHKSMLCLLDRDESHIAEVLANEDHINQLEIRIDSLATRLVALNQPVAVDMRLIIAALKINTDLERMGDLAVSIVHRAGELIRMPALEPVVPVADQAALVETMVENSITAFVDRNADLAHQVLLSDDKVDLLRNEIYEALASRMEADGHAVRRALLLVVIARNLERIADHATNVAEDIIFLVRGVDVRHHNEHI
jgi:phosphate transport system protein